MRFNILLTAISIICLHQACVQACPMNNTDSDSNSNDVNPTAEEINNETSTELEDGNPYYDDMDNSTAENEFPTDDYYFTEAEINIDDQNFTEDENMTDILLDDPMITEDYSYYDDMDNSTAGENEFPTEDYSNDYVTETEVSSSGDYEEEPTSNMTTAGLDPIFGNKGQCHCMDKTGFYEIPGTLCRNKVKFTKMFANILNRDARMLINKDNKKQTITRKYKLEMEASFCDYTNKIPREVMDADKTMSNELRNEIQENSIKVFFADVSFDGAINRCWVSHSIHLLETILDEEGVELDSNVLPELPVPPVLRVVPALPVWQESFFGRKKIPSIQYDYETECAK